MRLMALRFTVAAALLALCLAPCAAHASQAVATVIGIEGKAWVESDSGKRDLQLKSQVFMQEEIVTAAASKVEVMLQDDTVLSQGQNSRLKVADFAYDPASKGASKALIKMGAGVFRAVSGKIVESNPEGFKMESPMASIGIRGTMTAHTIGGEVEQHFALDLSGNHTVVIQNLAVPGQTQTITGDNMVVVITPTTTAPPRPATPGELQQVNGATTVMPGQGSGTPAGGDQSGSSGSPSSADGSSSPPPSPATIASDAGVRLVPPITASLNEQAQQAINGTTGTGEQGLEGGDRRLPGNSQSGDNGNGFGGFAPTSGMLFFPTFSITDIGSRLIPPTVTYISQRSEDLILNNPSGPSNPPHTGTIQDSRLYPSALMNSLPADYNAFSNYFLHGTLPAFTLYGRGDTSSSNTAAGKLTDPTLEQMNIGLLFTARDSNLAPTSTSTNGLTLSSLGIGGGQWQGTSTVPMIASESGATLSGYYALPLGLEAAYGELLPGSATTYIASSSGDSATYALDGGVWFKGIATLPGMLGLNAYRGITANYAGSAGAIYSYNGSRQYMTDGTFACRINFVTGAVSNFDLVFPTLWLKGGSGTVETQDYGNTFAVGSFTSMTMPHTAENSPGLSGKAVGALYGFEGELAGGTWAMDNGVSGTGNERALGVFGGRVSNTSIPYAFLATTTSDGSNALDVYERGESGTGSAKLTFDLLPPDNATARDLVGLVAEGSSLTPSSQVGSTTVGALRGLSIDGYTWSGPSYDTLGSSKVKFIENTSTAGPFGLWSGSKTEYISPDTVTYMSWGEWALESSVPLVATASDGSSKQFQLVRGFYIEGRPTTEPEINALGSLSATYTGQAIGAYSLNGNRTDLTPSGNNFSCNINFASRQISNFNIGFQNGATPFLTMQNGSGSLASDGTFTINTFQNIATPKGFLNTGQGVGSASGMLYGTQAQGVGGTWTVDNMSRVQGDRERAVGIFHGTRP